MRPDIKFDKIGTKLVEISLFEKSFFFIPQNALQAGSVQQLQIRAPNVEKCNLDIVLSVIWKLYTYKKPASK